jgi:Cu2+-containing amine oxidase
MRAMNRREFVLALSAIPLAARYAPANVQAAKPIGGSFTIAGETLPWNAASWQIQVAMARKFGLSPSRIRVNESGNAFTIAFLGEDEVTSPPLPLCRK